jgi:hypothetical protein
MKRAVGAMAEPARAEDDSDNEEASLDKSNQARPKRMNL